MTTKANNPRCAVCGGELQATTITHEEKRDNQIYLFQNVPAKVCAACGEIWIDEEVLQQIDKLIEYGVYLSAAGNCLAPKTEENATNSTCFGGGKAVVSHLFYSQLAVLALVWLFVLLPVTGSKPGLLAPPMPAKPKRTRSTAPTPCAGLTHRPHCALCEQETVRP